MPWCPTTQWRQQYVCRVYTFIRRDGEKDSACQGLRNKNYPHYQRHAPYPPILLYKICNQRVNNRDCDQHVPFNVRRGNESDHNQCSHICRLVLAVREVLEHVAKMVNRNEENRSKCYKPDRQSTRLNSSHANIS